MAVEIGSKYKENLCRVRIMALSAIGESRDSKLTHAFINRNEKLQVIVSLAEENARCYQCRKHIDKEKIRVEIISENEKRERYYFHVSDLFY